MCIFCDIVNKRIDANVVYEDNLVIAFLDCNPINEGHVLLIPKVHYLDIDEFPVEVLKHLMEVSQKLVVAIKQVYQPDGYSIMQNGGRFNDIGHYHLHIFARYENDGFGWDFSEEAFEHSEKVAEQLRKVLYN